MLQTALSLSGTSDPTNKTQATKSFDNMFQYDTPTIEATGANGEVYTLDTASLNAYIRRAWNANRENWKYKLGGNLDPTLDALSIVKSSAGETDCTGYVWWAFYKKRQSSGLYPKSSNFVPLKHFIAGCGIRHPARSGSTFGHAGFCVNVIDNSDGTQDLETLDMNGPGVVYRGPNTSPTANAKWSNNLGDITPVVSTDAILSIDGVPFKPDKFNSILALARKPILTIASLVVIFAAVTIGTVLVVRKYKSMKIAEEPDDFIDVSPEKPLKLPHRYV